MFMMSLLCHVLQLSTDRLHLCLQLFLNQYTNYESLSKKNIVNQYLINDWRNIEIDIRIKPYFHMSV